jgi:hypothetical protein
MTDEPTEFCQRHMGGYVEANRRSVEAFERDNRQPTAQEANEEFTRRLYAAHPHMPVMAQEVTARDARIAELEAENRILRNHPPLLIQTDRERELKAQASGLLEMNERLAQRDLADNRTIVGLKADNDDLARRLAESEEIARIRSDHIAVLEAENADQSRRLADLENRATVKIAGHWTAPMAIPITEGPAPMPQNALDHSA